MYEKLSQFYDSMARLSDSRNGIDNDLYKQHHVFCGLRDLKGKGVVTGLTEISHIKAKDISENGEEIPCKGKLYYRGIDIDSIVEGFLNDDRFGFEETMYLLLFSRLPNSKELQNFKAVLEEIRTLPPSFTRDMILKAPGKDIMNMLSRSVLALYTYDDDPDNTSISNVLRQCLFLISVFPILSAYAYQSFSHYHCEEGLFLNKPEPGYSTSEILLSLIRKDGKFTPLEAKVLDLALVLHAEHGGGNNSTFTTHVVTSSGTDTYSAISAALGSLKGPRHGGANIKVVQMFNDMKNSIDITNKAAIQGYLEKLLDKQAFDQSGLIYGMGHAVYSLSDPRSEILKGCAEKLAIEKGCEQEYSLYKTVAELAPQIIASKRQIFKGVSANVDFYSGMIYSILDIPEELFTPIFAIARIVGWSAHRIEEIQNNGKIIRPAYINVKEETPYINLCDRI